jgi:hypothetical protein
LLLDFRAGRLVLPVNGRALKQPDADRIWSAIPIDTRLTAETCPDRGTRQDGQDGSREGRQPMTEKLFSRRKLLERSLQIPLGGVLLAAMATKASTAQAADKACVDMEHLDAGQKSIRESLNYVNKSPHPNMTCGQCGFFEAKGDGCGNCMIFTGPAAAAGHCDSWSAKS